MMRYDFPDVVFLSENHNVGFAKSVNRGILKSSGEFLLIINADIIVSDAKAIPKMLEHIIANKEIGILGPGLLNINGDHQPSCFRFYSPKTVLSRRTPFGKTPWGKRELDRFLYTGQTCVLHRSDPCIGCPRPVDWLMGSALLVRKNAYNDVGPMDENYFMYMEDVDWCRRFWEKGWKVAYYPETFFYHYHFQASKKRGSLIDLLTNKYARVHLLSAFKYFKKYGLKTPKYGV